jgi:methionyl-tRNA formyltransferase
MNIVFFGTSNVALPVLEALRREHNISAVVTSPDAKIGRRQVLTPSPVALLAGDLGLPLLKPDSVKNNEAFLAQLRQLAADIYIVVSYGKILPLAVINLPAHKTLNLHFSRLPQYRGASPIQFALMNGDTETATTIFVLDEQLDHGPIVAQQESAIEPDDTFLTLSQRMARQSTELLLDVLPDYISGKITPLPQDHDQATYTKIITKQDGRIDWELPSQKIYDRFRALYPWPGIWTTTAQGKSLKILACAPVAPADGPSGPNEPGTVLPGGVVACGNGTFLKVASLQLEGKNPTGIAEFLNGYRGFAGSKLI